jgi:Plasmid pRiA4b ORF-3-like protein
MNRGRQTFVFKVTLRHTKPAIWRRIEVPGTYTFWDLHVAIQDAMGWLDYHLHQFHVEDRNTGAIAEIGIPDPDPFIGDPLILPGWQVPLTAYVKPDAVTISYTYDFGDDWEHRVALETVGIRDDRVSYPRCLAGARACPLEDCGGPRAYGEMVRAIANRGRASDKTTPITLPGEFDPAAFDRERVRFDDPKARWDTAFRER